MRINYNGDHLGLGQQTVEAFLSRLQTETLCPTFEKYGNFVSDLSELGDEYRGMVRVAGNFLTISAAFSFDGTPDEVRPLVDAIRANQSTLAYKEAKDAPPSWFGGPRRRAVAVEISEPDAE